MNITFMPFTSSFLYPGNLWLSPLVEVPPATIPLSNTIIPKCNHNSIYLMWWLLFSHRWVSLDLPIVSWLSEVIWLFTPWPQAKDWHLIKCINWYHSNFLYSHAIFSSVTPYLLCVWKHLHHDIIGRIDGKVLTYRPVYKAHSYFLDWEKLAINTYLIVKYFHYIKNTLIPLTIAIIKKADISNWLSNCKSTFQKLGWQLFSSHDLYSPLSTNSLNISIYRLKQNYWRNIYTDDVKMNGLIHHR